MDGKFFSTCSIVLVGVFDEWLDNYVDYNYSGELAKLENGLQ